MAEFNIMKAPTSAEAVAGLLKEWHYERETEYVPLAECLGRVTAEDVRSVNTLPAMRVSAMDGFAVKSSAFAQGTPELSGWVLGRDYAPADTGDDFPDDFDTVIAVEKLHYDAQGKLVLEPDYQFKKGANIRPAGSTMAAGDLLLKKHTQITIEAMVNLANGGLRTVPCIRKLRIAFIPTGSELTPVGTEPLRGMNIETNSMLVSHYIRRWGAEPVCLPIVRDDPEKLEAALDEAMKLADIVLVNGGSSKGGEDYNTRMLERRASYFHHNVRAVPGRPVGISVIEGKPVINMPGPSLAAFVVNDYLVHSLICSYYDIPVHKRQTIECIMDEDMKKGPPMEVYNRVAIEKRGDSYYAKPFGRGAKGSESLREGLGILIAPVGSFGYQKGEKAPVQLLTGEECIPVGETPADSDAPELPANCDQCPNACPADRLSCGRGMAHFARLRKGEKPFTSDNPVAQYLVTCGDAVKNRAGMMAQHGADVGKLFGALNEQEQTQLVELLKKLNDRWNEEHYARHRKDKT